MQLNERLLGYGEWAVVTGASDGIGRQIAQRLAFTGVKVVLVARRESRLRQIAAELEQRTGVEARVHAADLGEAGAVAQLMAATRELDVGLLVAAAGFGTSGSFIDSKLADELAMIDVNCRAVAELCHHFGARFRERGRGGIVLMSSLVAFQGVPRATGYAATKAWVQSFAEGLRVELAPLGVDVVASAPGPVHSGFAERADMVMGAADAAETVAAGTLAALGRRTTTRPGRLSKLLGWSLSLLPRWARVRVMTLVMDGMTQHQLRALPAQRPAR